MEGNDHWESPRDRVIAPQAADLLCRETLAVGRLPTLAIANAGNDIVWVMSRQSAKKGQGIFIGGRPVHLIAFPGQSQLGNQAAAPTQRQISTAFLTLYFEHHFLEEGAEKFLAIAVGGGRRSPDEPQVGTETVDSLAFFLG
jgi:hypothetical protein